MVNNVGSWCSPHRPIPHASAINPPSPWAALLGAHPGPSTLGLFIILTAFSHDLGILQGPVVSFATFYITLNKSSQHLGAVVAYLLGCRLVKGNMGSTVRFYLTVTRAL